MKKRIMFIHGFMGSALNWGRIRTLLEVANPGIITQSVDMLGHALRHLTREQNQLVVAHDALIATLKFDLETFAPTHVVAHSFGLRPSLLIGVAHPALVPHLIIEDASPELTKEGAQFLEGVLATPVPFVDRDAARSYFDEHYGTGSALSRFLLSNIRSQADGGSDWRLDLQFLKRLLVEAFQQPLWNEWSTFQGKLDLIYGSNSGLSFIEKMQALRPTVDVHKIDDAGHWVHSDQPAVFVSALSLIINKG